MNRILVGALAGIAGTYAMTAAMEVLSRHLPGRERYPMPPREVAQGAIEQTLETCVEDEESLGTATIASHFGFGAFCAVLFTVLGLDRNHAVRNGAIYGVGIWIISYLGWIPAAAILKPASRHPAHRNLLMIAVHVVWGAVTGHASSALMRSGRIFGNRHHRNQRDRPGRHPDHC